MSSSAASLYICPPIFSTLPVNSNSSKVASKIFISICVFAWIASISSIPSFRTFSILLCVLPNSSWFIFLVPESLCSNLNCFWFGTKDIRDNSSRISSALQTSLACCCAIRLFAPALAAESILPGTAKTSRFCSNANAAVIFAPLFFRASVTTMHLDRPLIMRLRMGKFLARGFTPRGNSETRAPLFVISSASFLFSGG